MKLRFRFAQRAWAHDYFLFAHQQPFLHNIIIMICCRKRILDYECILLSSFQILSQNKSFASNVFFSAHSLHIINMMHARMYVKKEESKHSFHNAWKVQRNSNGRCLNGVYLKEKKREKVNNFQSPFEDDNIVEMLPFLIYTQSFSI